MKKIEFHARAYEISGTKPSGEKYLRTAYQVVANVGLGKKRARQIAAELNRIAREALSTYRDRNS